MNLYNRLVIRPLSVQQIARATFNHGGQAVIPHVNADSLFDRSARSSVDEAPTGNQYNAEVVASISGLRGLSGRGRMSGLGGLGRLGSLSGGGGQATFGTYFKFSEEWSSDDFPTDAHYNKWVKPYLWQLTANGGDPGEYVPVPQETKERAAAKWANWLAAAEVDSAAKQYVFDKNAAFKTAIDAADACSIRTKGWPYVASREESVEVERYAWFRRINALIAQIAADDAPSSQNLAAGPLKTPGVAPKVTADYTETLITEKKAFDAIALKQKQDAAVAAALAARGGNQSSTGASTAAPAGGPPWALIAGGGVLVAVGIGYVLLSKKGKK